MNLINDFINSIKFTDFIYLASGFFTFLAYMVTNMVLLRSFIITAAILGLVYGSIIGQSLFTVGQGCLVLLNSVQIGIILYNTKAFFLGDPWREFYEKSFTAMTPREFMDLVKLGTQFKTTNETLCKQSQLHERLIYLIDGEAEVTRDSEVIAIAQKGNFLGEMSFLTQEAQEADVVGLGAVSYLSWDKKTLLKLKRKKPELHTKLLNALGVDLINKLRVHRDTIMTQNSLPPVV